MSNFPKNVLAAPIAAVVPAVENEKALAAPIAASVAESAINLANADIAYELAFDPALAAVARAMGTEPSYDHWTAVCYAWKVAYRTRRNCAEKTSDNRWSDIANGLRDRHEQTKPAKPSVDAVRVKDKRDALKTTVESAKAQCVKPSDALEKAVELIKSGKAKEAEAYTKAAIELSKAADDEATKCAKSAIKDAKEKIKKELTAIDDAELLRAVLALLVNGLPKKGAKPSKSKQEEKAPF